MTNREFVNDYLSRAKLPSVLKQEIEYLIYGVDREEIEGEPPYDLCDAFFDAYTALDYHPDRKLWNAIKPVLVDIGYARHVTDSELEKVRVWSSGSGRWSKDKEDFIFKGKKYQVREPISAWPDDQREAL